MATHTTTAAALVGAIGGTASRFVYCRLTTRRNGGKVTVSDGQTRGGGVGRMFIDIYHVEILMDANTGASDEIKRFRTFKNAQEYARRFAIRNKVTTIVERAEWEITRRGRCTTDNCEANLCAYGPNGDAV